MEDSVNDSWDESMSQLDPALPPSKVSVIDLIDPSVPRANQAKRAERMAICKGCDKLKLGTLCSECNCVMKFKTWLEPADCPLGKW